MSMMLKGRTSLITGASSGLGEEFARQLAARGSDLLLVARRRDRLNAICSELRGQYGIRAEPFPMDLRKEDAAERLFRDCTQRGLRIHMLINNAGIGGNAPFTELPMERQTDIVRLNVLALLKLTHVFLPSMIQHQDGGVINVASTAGFQPVPYMATYAATKAFVISFTQAIAREVKQYNVRVMALCPGQTETEFHDVNKVRKHAIAMSASTVVRQALRAFDREATLCVPGFRNKLMVFSERLSPRSLVVEFAQKLYEPES